MPTKLEVYRGPLQLKTLMALMEGPSFGMDLMKKLNITSPGTMYPVLKFLKNQGLIEIKSRVKRKKYYGLSEKGKESLQKMLLDMSQKHFSVYVNPYLQPLIHLIKGMIKLTPNLRILSNWNFEPTKQWLSQMDVTYQQFPEEPKGSYNLAIIQLIGTMIFYGWKKDELSHYLSKIIESLEPESTLVMIEIERVNNISFTKARAPYPATELLIDIAQFDA